MSELTNIAELLDELDVKDTHIAEMEAENTRLTALLEDYELARKGAEAALAERDELLSMLEVGGVRIVSDGGSFTLAEFRRGVADLRARAEEGSET